MMFAVRRGVHHTRPVLSRCCAVAAAAVCLWFTVLSAPREGAAQSRSDATPPPVIARVAFTGDSALDTAVLRRVVSSRAGMRLDAAMIQRDVRAMWALGKAGNIEVVTTPASNNRVAVWFHITAAPVVRAVRIIGAERIGDAVAQRVVAIPMGQSLSPPQVKRGALKLASEFEWQGYPDCTVVTESRRVADGVEVVFRVHPGSPVTVRSVRIVGNRALTTRALLDAMDTRGGTVNTRGGILLASRLETDTRRMLALYYARGHVAAMVFPPALRRSPGGAHVDIVIRVREGKAYRLGGLSFSGKLHGSTVQHRKLVALRPGDRFDATRVAQAQVALRRYYRRAGYPGTHVDISSDIDSARGVISLEVRVDR